MKTRLVLSKKEEELILRLRETNTRRQGEIIGLGHVYNGTDGAEADRITALIQARENQTYIVYLKALDP